MSYTEEDRQLDAAMELHEWRTEVIRLLRSIERTVTPATPFLDSIDEALYGKKFEGDEDVS